MDTLHPNGYNVAGGGKKNYNVQTTERRYTPVKENKLNFIKKFTPTHSNTYTHIRSNKRTQVQTHTHSFIYYKENYVYTRLFTYIYYILYGIR